MQNAHKAMVKTPDNGKRPLACIQGVLTMAHFRVLLKPFSRIRVLGVSRNPWQFSAEGFCQTPVGPS